MPPPGSSVEELQNIWFDTSRPAAERAAAAEEVWNRTGARLAEPKPKAAPPPLGMSLVSANRTPVAPAVNTLPAPADPGTEQIAPAMPIEEFVAAQGGSTVSPIPKATPGQIAPLAGPAGPAVAVNAPMPQPGDVPASAKIRQGITVDESGRPMAPQMPAGGWRQPTASRDAGAPSWLTSAVTQDFAETEPSRDEQIVGEVDPSAARDLRLDRYAGEAAAQARDFKLFPSTVTPQEAGELRDIAERQAQNVADTFEAQEYARQAVQRAAKAAQDKQDAIDAENILREKERNQQLANMEQSYREMADENFKEPIDSERSWNRKSTGEKIMAGIGIFLGTLGSAITKQPNIAWEMLQKQADRDIEAQKANKALMGNRIAAEGSLIDMARQRFSSEAAVDAAARATAYARIQGEIARFAESAKTPERKAALDGLMLEADKARLGQEQALRLTLQSDQYKRDVALAQKRAAGAPLTPQQQLDRLLKIRRTQVGIKNAEAELAGGGAPGFGLTESQAGEQLLTIAQKEAAIRRMEDLHNQLKESSKVGDAFQRESIKQQAVDTWAILEGKRQMTKEEQEGGAKALFAGASAVDTFSKYIEGQKREIERQRRKIGSLPVAKKGKRAESD